MANGHRLAFLIVEAEPAQGLSTRKLLLESAKHNVVTAYSPQEGTRMFRRFPHVDVVAVDGSFGEEACSQLVRQLKEHHAKIRIVGPTGPREIVSSCPKGTPPWGITPSSRRARLLPESELETFDSLGTRLQGHPDMHKVPGVDMSTGSLGQGLSCGIGMALGARVKHGDFHVFTLLGDGECQEGQVWEAALYAGSPWREAACRHS